MVRLWSCSLACNFALGSAHFGWFVLSRAAELFREWSGRFCSQTSTNVRLRRPRGDVIFMMVVRWLSVVRVILVALLSNVFRWALGIQCLWASALGTVCCWSRLWVRVKFCMAREHAGEQSPGREPARLQPGLANRRHPGVTSPRQRVGMRSRRQQHTQRSNTGPHLPKNEGRQENIPIHTESEQPP